MSKLKLEKAKSLSEWRSSTGDEWLTSAEGFYSKGLIYLWIEDYENALFNFKKAVEKDSGYFDAYFLIGYCNGKLGRYSEAIESYKQAIQIKPDYAEAHFNLGMTYIIVGDKGSALDEYKILKDINKQLANKLFNLIYR